MRPRSSDASESFADPVFDTLPDYGAVDLPADDFAQSPVEADADAAPRRTKSGRKPTPRFEPAPAPAPRPTAALVVCLACGEGPHSSNDCPHHEVLHLPEATLAQQAAAHRLAQLARDLRAQQRTLHRLAADALGRNEATLALTGPALAPTPSRSTGPSGGPGDAPCPRCGQSPDGAARRRRSPAVAPGALAQATFAFVAPAEPPVAQPVAPPDALPDAQPDASSPADG